MSRRYASYAALATGVLAFSTSGVVAKLCSEPAITIAFWVRAFSLGYLIAAFVAQRHRRRRALLTSAWRHGGAAGVVFAVHILLYFWALKLTSVTVVFLLGALNPAVVGIFGWLFLNERPTRQQALWIAVAIGATVAVVVGRDVTGESRLFGNLIALGSALAYCGYFLVARHARRSLGTTEFLVITTLVSMIAAGAVALVGGVSLRIGAGNDLWMIAFLGLVPGTIGHLTVNWALRHVEAHAASTVLLAVPLFASLWAHVAIGERVALGQIVAGAIVLLAIPGAARRPEVPPVYEALPAPISSTR